MSTQGNFSARPRTRRAMRGLGITSAVLVAIGLAGCGEYSPLADDAADPPTHTQRGDGGEQPPSSDGPDDGNTEPGAQRPPAADIPAPSNPGAEDSGGGVDPGPQRRSPRAGAPRADADGVQGTPPSAGGNTGAPGVGNPGGVGGSYPWRLPQSDVSPNEYQNGPAYGWLQDPTCEQAEGWLENGYFHSIGSSYIPWGFTNPRFAVFFSAGIAMCRDDIAAARTSYTHAVDEYSTSGIDRPSHPLAVGGNGKKVEPPWRRGYGEPECDLYRTLTSVLTNVAADTVSCPGGLSPVFKFVDYETTNGTVRVFDNPLTFDDDPSTDEDESLIPPPGWNQQPGVEGTSLQTGEPVYGDPDDEFGKEHSLQGSEPPQSELLAEEELAADTAMVEPADEVEPQPVAQALEASATAQVGAHAEAPAAAAVTQEVPAPQPEESPTAVDAAMVAAGTEAALEQVAASADVIAPLDDTTVATQAP